MHVRHFNSNHYTAFIKFAVAIAAMMLIFVRPALSADQNQHVIFALGDSLTAGYGLDAGLSFPDQLESALQADGLDVLIINAGVSGDTSKGGQSRLDWALGDGPAMETDLAIVALGANDALRGIDPASTRKNLTAIIEDLQARGITVLLAGMLAPPNMGPDYAAEFNPIYGDLAAQYDVALYPFFLDGVAADPSLNLEDGMHPNAEGIGVMVERMKPLVKSLLKE